MRRNEACRFFPILIAMFFYSYSGADTLILPPQRPAFSNEGLRESYNAAQTVKALEEDCESSPTEESLLQIQETLEEANKPSQLEFICEVKSIIDEENNKVKENREFMLNYIQSKTHSAEDHQRMTELMIKHRMLMNDQKGKPYHAPSTRFTPPEIIQQKIREMAKNHIRDHGPPNTCSFHEGNFIKVKGMDSDRCRDEIIRKVQSIPSPLILSQCAQESGWGTQQKYDNILGLQVVFTYPETMPDYPNCRQAKEAPKRCLLKFDGLEGSIDEYFTRFNGSPIEGFQIYRDNRLNLYKSQSNLDECQMARALIPSMKFYATDKKYRNHLKGMLGTEGEDGKICQMIKECESKSGRAKPNIKKNHLEAKTLHPKKL